MSKPKSKSKSKPKSKPTSNPSPKRKTFVSLTIRHASAKRPSLRQLLEQFESTGLNMADLGDHLFRLKHDTHPAQTTSADVLLLEAHYQAGVLAGLAFGSSALNR